jgi:hypothetical protein
LELSRLQREVDQGCHLKFSISVDEVVVQWMDSAQLGATTREWYVACEASSSGAVIGDPDELTELAWSAAADLPTLVPHGFYAPVQQFMDAALAGGPHS